MPSTKFQFLYYITHVDNLESILVHGIYSHARMEAENIQFTPIYDASIVAGRKDRTTPTGESLWSYANTYFQPRNAMLFRVAREKGVDNLCVLAIQSTLVNDKSSLITTGNAASQYSDFITGSAKTKAVPGIIKQVSKQWWSNVDGSKREMMAECLVPGYIPPDFVRSVYVGNETALKSARSRVPSSIGHSKS